MTDIRAGMPNVAPGLPGDDLPRQLSHQLVAVALNQQALVDEFAHDTTAQSTTTQAPAYGICTIDLPSITGSGSGASGPIPRPVQQRICVHTHRIEGTHNGR